MTLNASLNIAKQAILNNQFGLNIISNNVSNMNTPGYCRQSAAFSSTSGYNTYNYASSNQFLIGEGAQMDAILRNRDQFMDNRYRDQASTTGFYTQIGSMTSLIESTLNEVGKDGLQKAFNDFFAAADALAGDPTNSGYRTSYVSALQNVTDKFNQMSSSLKTAIRENVGEVGDPSSFNSSRVKNAVDDLNGKLAQLADYNQQILQNSSVKGAANELLDKRDALIDDISAIIPISVTQNPNNTVNVSFDNMTLVDGNKQYLEFKAVQGTTEDEPAIIQVIDLEQTDPAKNPLKTNINEKIDSGTLGAILSTAGSKTVDGVNLTTVLKQLNQLASAFAEELNNIQTVIIDGKSPLALGPDGQLIESTIPIFTTSDGAAEFTAENIQVNEEIINNPNNIATARADITSADFDAAAVGNSANMDLVLNLKDGKLDSLATDAGGAPNSLNGFLTDMVSTVGNKISSIDNKTETQQAIMNQVDSQRTALYGVNLEEEITDMLKFQRAYEAAARVFNVTSQMMQIITQLGA